MYVTNVIIETSLNYYNTKHRCSVLYKKLGPNSTPLSSFESYLNASTK